MNETLTFCNLSKVAALLKPLREPTKIHFSTVLHAHKIIKLTLLFLQFDVLHICFGIFLLEVQFQVFVPVLFFEILGLGLDHLERRESEERRWLRGHRSLLLQLLRYLPRRTRTRLQALLRAVGEAVVVVVVMVVVVAVFVAVRYMLTCAEVGRFRILLLQLMRLVGPVLSVLVVMELPFLLFFLVSLPFVRWRRHVPFLLLFPLFNKSVKTIPQPFFFYFGTEQVHLSCHLCTYSTFKGPCIPTAQVPENL